MLEDEVDEKIMLQSTQHGVTLFRNNSGCFTDATGRVVRFGLANISKKQNDVFKSSDRIGFTEVLITPTMVGKKLAVFTAIEVKREGWGPKNLDARETAQKNFIDFVRSRGGIAAFCNSAQQFLDLFKK